MKYCFLLLSFFLSFQTFSSSIDSLLGVWNNKSLSDSLRCRALAAVIVQNINRHEFTDSTLYYGHLLHDFAKDRKQLHFQSGALSLIGGYYVRKSNYVEAIKYSLKAVHIAERANNPVTLTHIYGNHASLFSEMGDQYKSLKYYELALHYAREGELTSNLSQIYKSIGLVYQKLEKYDKALEFQLKSLEVYPEEHNNAVIADILMQIGKSYASMDDLVNAIIFHERSIKIGEKIDDSTIICHGLFHLGVIFYENDNLQKALEVLSRSISFNEKASMPLDLSRGLLLIGRIYFDQKDYQKAIGYFFRALNCAKTHHILEIEESSLEYLYKTDKETEDFQKSLEFYEMYNIVVDSLAKMREAKDLQLEEIKYNYQKEKYLYKMKHSQELQEGRRKQIILYWSISITLLLIYAAVRIYYLKVRKKKIELLEEIAQLKSKLIIKLASDSIQKDFSFQSLDKTKIEKSIDATLNQTDWNVINVLYEEPSISTSQLAVKINLSVEGVYSSLKKMYRLFGLKGASGNQRFNLIIEASKMSI